MKRKSISQMGYRDDSPFRHFSSIDIHTPSGMIDMSGTGIPLLANGRFLPPYSGQHQFNTNVVTETPFLKSGGLTQNQYLLQRGLTNANNHGDFDNISANQARKILHNKMINNKPLTDEQRRLFGFLSKGATAKYQAGGRLVQQVPNDYLAIPGMPNYFQKQLQKAQATTGAVQANGPKMTNEQWRAYLAKKAMNQQQGADTVFIKPQLPLQQLAPKPITAFGDGTIYNDPNINNEVIGAYGYPTRKSKAINDPGTVNTINDFSQMYWQDRNNRNQPLGKPFPINRNEVISIGDRLNPNGGQQKLDSSRNAFRNRSLVNKFQSGVNNFQPIYPEINPELYHQAIQRQPDTENQQKLSGLPDVSNINTDLYHEGVRRNPDLENNQVLTGIPDAASALAFLNKNDKASERLKKKRYDPFASMALKQGILGANALFSAIGANAENNYQLNANRLRMQEDGYNGAYSFVQKDYGSIKMGGVVKKKFQDGGEFDAYDFLDIAGNEDVVDQTDTQTASNEELDAVKAENEQLKLQQEQQKSDSEDAYLNSLADSENARHQSFVDGLYANDNYSEEEYANSSPKNDNEVTTRGNVSYPQQLSGDSAAARNNNPGNIKYASWMKEYGAVVGSKALDGGNFAKFPNIQNALEARKKLLTRPIYANRSFDDAMRTYSNNGYSGNIFPELKGKKMKDLTNEQLSELTKRQIKKEDGRVAKQLGIYERGGKYDVSQEELNDLIKKGIKFNLI